MQFDIASLFFLITAAILVGSALLVVTMRRIVHSALFLAVVFAAAAGIYILLNAEFIAVVQVLIYAGAVSILVLFAIMLTQASNTPRSNPVNKTWWLAALICVMLGAAIIFPLTTSPKAVTSSNAGVAAVGTSAGRTASPAASNASSNNVARIGQLLYSPIEYSYVLPFEIASLVLLVAIIGAIVISREDL
jgi:NADH:ubiquinone oxidoreductase subunit 6 (subunit J)